MHALARNLHKKSWRHADVADVNRANKWLRGRLCEPNLHRRKRASVIRFDGVSRCIARIAIKPTGHIDGELLRRLCIYPFDNDIKRWPRIAGRASAQQGIDDPSWFTGLSIKLRVQI